MPWPMRWVRCSPSGELPARRADGYLLHVSRRAMACTFECFFNAGQYPHATEAALAALDLVDRLEDQLSVYREHSEISRLNRSRRPRSRARSSRDCSPCSSRPCALFEETAGAYDITAARLSAVWGFTRRTGAIPRHDDSAAARERVGSQFVELDQPRCTVRFSKAGVEINLGSIGKGYALDRCAELLAERAAFTIFCCTAETAACSPRSERLARRRQGWSVGVRNPLQPGSAAGPIALATIEHWPRPARARSFSCTRDDATDTFSIRAPVGRPRACLSVSVLAPTAAEADALSTAFYVMGPNRRAGLLCVPSGNRGDHALPRCDRVDWKNI